MGVIGKTMTPDLELLSQYATHGDETAFAELVRRQVNLVYSVALRVAHGNGAMAEDVTQSVFTDLARKAGPLSHHQALAGWLHTSARYTAMKAIRSEQRRQTHEKEATMHDLAPTTELDWEQLRPILDEAVGRLHEKERAAIVLRFFQGLSHREVGEALGLNENTARKRVDRALEKLRAQFTRTGITVSATVLASAITANSVQAAPVGLAGKISRLSIASATGGTSILTSALLRIFLMSTKTKIAAFAVTAAMLAFLLTDPFHWFGQSLSPSPIAAATPPPSISPTTKISLPPKAVAAPTPPLAPTVAIQSAATISTKPALASPRSANPQSDLNSALVDIATRLRAGDLEGTLKTYLPVPMTEQQVAQTREIISLVQMLPSSSKEMSLIWPQMLDKLVDQTPTLSDEGNHAAYTMPVIAGLPAADTEKPGYLVLTKSKGLWYIEQFSMSGYEIDMRPSAEQKKNPQP